MKQLQVVEDFKALMYYRSKRVAASTIPGKREFMNHSVLMIMFNLVDAMRCR